MTNQLRWILAGAALLFLVVSIVSAVIMATPTPLQPVPVPSASGG